ncbi:MAG: dihydrofolate reductase [Trueperaceae bacterium]|nr:dihydrofolate reductase [Trueperaceae bacterium]
MIDPVRLIAAMTRDRVIGRGDGMPWNVPDEYRHFLDSVRGGAVIMGRRSFEIFGADLRDARPIVLTRRDSAPHGALPAGDLEAALRAARRLDLAPWIAGGASVYEQALPLCDEMHLSIVPGRYDGDRWFPDWDPAAWRLAEERPRPGYLFRRYVRRSR